MKKKFNLLADLFFKRTCLEMCSGSFGSKACVESLIILGL
jgi:hypothetical protein